MTKLRSAFKLSDSLGVFAEGLPRSGKFYEPDLRISEDKASWRWRCFKGSSQVEEGKTFRREGIFLK